VEKLVKSLFPGLKVGISLQRADEITLSWTDAKYLQNPDTLLPAVRFYGVLRRTADDFARPGLELYFDSLLLPASAAKKYDERFAGLFIIMRRHSHLVAVALQTLHVKTTERAFWRCLARLIILSAHEIAGGIH
jgi:hypothetical protein